MTRRDPYDAVVAFDDMDWRGPLDHLGNPLPLVDCAGRGRRFAAHADAGPAVRAVMRRALARRPARRPMRVVPAPAGTASGAMMSLQISGPRVGPTARGGYEVLGDDARGRYPLFDALRGRFERAQPDLKVVRLDTPASYADFRDERCAPRCAALEERLAAVEAALGVHLTAHDPLRVVLGVDDAARREARVGGVRVPLHPGLQGKAKCWADGDEILCSIRFQAPGGTCGSPPRPRRSSGTSRR